MAFRDHEAGSARIGLIVKGGLGFGVFKGGLGFRVADLVAVLIRAGSLKPET